MKRIKWIVGSILVLIVVVLVIVFMSINGIVRNQVEVQATSALDLKTTLGSANVSILGASLGLDDLAIASPKGFNAPHMFQLGGAKLGVSLGNLRADPIAIDRLAINKPKLIIEQANGKFNFKTLTEMASKPTPEGSQPVKLIIRELSINDAEVVVRPGIPGLDKETTIAIPSLTIKDIGTGKGNQNGAALKEVVMLTIMSLAQKATESGVLPDNVKSLLKADVDQISRQLEGEVHKQIEKISKDAAKEVEKAVGEGLGNLLKPPAQQPK